MLLNVISTGSRHGNCYALIADSGQTLLLDFGCEKKKILRGIEYNVSNVVGAVLSHKHSDHSKSYKWLLDNKIPIYSNAETAEDFDGINGIPEMKWIQCGEFKVMGFYLPHDDCPNYGFLIEHEEMGRMLYMTDLEYCPYNFKKLHIQHLLVETNYIEDLVNREADNYSHQLKGHCSLNTCKGIVDANKTANLQTVTLIHLSDKVCDPTKVLSEIKAISEESVAVNVAVPGLCINLEEFPF